MTQSLKPLHKPMTSGEEVLEHYFDALLVDDDDLMDLDTSGVSDHREGFVVASPALEESTVATLERPSTEDEPQPQAATEPSSSQNDAQLETEVAHLEPQLDDVQKLLNQMQQHNVSHEPDIESMLEQNTLNIRKTETQSPVPGVHVAAELHIAEAIPEDMPPLEMPQTVADLDVATETDVAAPLETESQAAEPNWESGKRHEEFQVLYFEVAGVLFAVPLEELGGIHRLEALNHLIGRPDWYLGLQSNRETKVDVVDTALWAMDDRISGVEHRQDYDYIIMLDQSRWGLASNALKGTELLPADAVNWREKPGKRPWLAGMVKQKMCVLIHVSAMVEMLDAGISMSMLTNEQTVISNV